jgi:hypothetical protein
MVIEVTTTIRTYIHENTHPRIRTECAHESATLLSRQTRRRQWQRVDSIAAAALIAVTVAVAVAVTVAVAVAIVVGVCCVAVTSDVTTKVHS